MYPKHANRKWLSRLALAVLTAACYIALFYLAPGLPFHFDDPDYSAAGR